MLVGVASIVPSGTGTNCPHPNHIMTDFFIKMIVPTMPLSSPGSERAVSGSSQADQTAAGSETANDTVSSRGASCCIAVATTAGAVSVVILCYLIVVVSAADAAGYIMYSSLPIADRSRHRRKKERPKRVSVMLSARNSESRSWKLKLSARRGLSLRMNKSVKDLGKRSNLQSNYDGRRPKTKR
jgi:hypothetical protein